MLSPGCPADVTATLDWRIDGGPERKGLTLLARVGLGPGGGLFVGGLPATLQHLSHALGGNYRGIAGEVRVLVSGHRSRSLVGAGVQPAAVMAVPLAQSDWRRVSAPAQSSIYGGTSDAGVAAKELRRSAGSALPTPTLRERPLRVALFSDSQSGAPVFRHLLAHAAALSPPVDAIVHVGDTVQNPSDPRELFAYLFAPLESFMRERGEAIPVVLVRGNHDPAAVYAGLTGEKISGEPADVPVPGDIPPTSSSSPSGTYYVSRMAGVRWIVLDATDPDHATQAEWLAAVCAAGEDPAAPFTIGLVHMPPAVEYWDPQAWGVGGESAWGAHVASVYLPILVGNPSSLGGGCGAAMVISGHSHVYQRGVGAGGVIMAIIGGAGGSLERPSDRVSDTRRYNITEFQHHFGVLTVGLCEDMGGGGGGVSSDTYGAGDQAQGGQRPVLCSPVADPTDPAAWLLRWEAFNDMGERFDVVEMGSAERREARGVR